MNKRQQRLLTIMRGAGPHVSLRQFNNSAAWFIQVNYPQKCRVSLTCMDVHRLVRDGQLKRAGLTYDKTWMQFYSLP